MGSESCRVVVHGHGPGARYGHVMALVGQRYLMVVGGNDGKLLCLILNEYSSTFIVSWIRSF